MRDSGAANCDDVVPGCEHTIRGGEKGEQDIGNIVCKEVKRLVVRWKQLVGISALA